MTSAAKAAERRVGDLVLRIEPGTFGHEARQLLPKPVETVPPQGRDHVGLVEPQPGIDVGRESQQGRRLDRVDLVEHQEPPPPNACELVHDRDVLLIEPLAGVDQQCNGVRIPGPAPGGRHHRPVEPALGSEDAGRVDEDDLARALHHDATHERARGLYLARDDRDLGAHERIDQRRFAGVGGADQRHEAAAGVLRHGRWFVGHSATAASTMLSRTMKAWAAACSAARLEGPVPCPPEKPSTTTSTVKCGAWAGPARLTSR